VPILMIPPSLLSDRLVGPPYGQSSTRGTTGVGPSESGNW
jgi:hypothetical protein